MPRIYDLVMTHRLDADDLFIQRVQAEAARRRLNFFLIEPLWVTPYHDATIAGQVWARVLINLHSEHHDPKEIYHRLVRLAATQGTEVVDHPDIARAAFDKQLVHPRLMWRGIHVPYTVFVAHDQIPTFQLTEEQRAALGTPFVIKPSLGYGRKGVILDATSEKDLTRSTESWPGGNYLLQRRIQPKVLEGRPAYFRVFHVFGEIWICWWDCNTHTYQLAEPGQTAQFPLDNLRDVVRRIADLTGMRFFSSEIAQTETGELVAIDYVNDQCHMLSQSANPAIGVPDTLICAIADRLVEAAERIVRR